jgi:GNAT superfamily N-acetyltransferase
MPQTTMVQPHDDTAAGALRRVRVRLAELSPEGSRERDDSGIESVSIPVPLANLTGLLLPDHPVDVGRLRMLAERFTARGLPWSISLTGPESAEVAAVARDLHLTRTVLPTLVMPLSQTASTNREPGSDRIVRVSSEEDLRRFAETADAAFDLPPGTTAILMSPEVMRAPEARAYLVIRDHRPVATAITLLDDRGWLGLYTVGTVREARRHGVGERLVRFVLQEGAALGAHSAFLQSSDMALPLYARVGFREDERPTVYFSSVGNSDEG